MTNKNPLITRSRIRFTVLITAAALCAVSLSFVERSSLAQKRTAVRVAKDDLPKSTSTRVVRDNKERRSQEPNGRRKNPKPQSMNYTPVSATTDTVGVPSIGSIGIQKTTAEIMNDQANAPKVLPGPRLMPEFEMPDRKNLPQDPNAVAAPAMINGQPVFGSKVRGATGTKQAISPFAPQTGKWSPLRSQSVSRRTGVRSQKEAKRAAPARGA